MHQALCSTLETCGSHISKGPRQVLVGSILCNKEESGSKFAGLGETAVGVVFSMVGGQGAW